MLYLLKLKKAFQKSENSKNFNQDPWLVDVPAQDVIIFFQINSFFDE